MKARTEGPGPAAEEKVVWVLPAYNEGENLPLVLEAIARAMTALGRRYAIVVVDDGSGDGTGEIAARYAATLPLLLERHATNQGLGRTIRDGLGLAVEQCAARDIVVAMDADNSHEPALLAAMLPPLAAGRDVVIASRFQPGAEIHGVPPVRQALSVAASLLFRAAFPIPGVRDYTCGYRAYRAATLRGAFARYGDHFVSEAGFTCMVDVLLKLHVLGARCGEVPMVLRYDLKRGPSKMRVTRTVLQTLALLVRRRWSRAGPPIDARRAGR